jgi:hypothetical protein
LQQQQWYQDDNLEFQFHATKHSIQEQWLCIQRWSEQFWFQPCCDVLIPTIHSSPSVGLEAI